MAKRFEGKVVLVTGGGSGMGYSTAERLSEEGARVVIVGRTEETLQQAASKIIKKTGGEVKVFPADVTLKASNREMVQAAITAFGRVDAAFLNAGGGPFKALSEVDEETFDTSFALNTRSVLFGIQAVAAAMKEAGIKGSIVSNSSAITQRVSPAFATAATYAAAKAASEMFVKYAAIEYADAGIRVNALAPGYVATPLHGPDSTDEKADEAAKGAQVVGRAGRPEEIAALAAHLLSDESTFTTGAVLVSDGGFALKA